MAIHINGSAAVVKNADSVTIILDTDAPNAVELRGVLAGVNASGIRELSPELRQLLHDLEAAMQGAFRVRVARKRARPAPGKVCEIPDCGCSGLAHP